MRLQRICVACRMRDGRSPDVAMPVFRAGLLMAFTCKMAHHQDPDGMTPGSMPANAADISQEGPSLPAPIGEGHFVACHHAAKLSLQGARGQEDAAPPQAQPAPFVSLPEHP